MNNIKEKYKLEQGQTRLNNKPEIWKDISWYEWLYQASDLWRIKSLIYYCWTNERILKSAKNKKWYLYIWLCKYGVKKTFQVHRLIALSFIDNLWHKEQVNHKNWIKDDNRVENLEWCTHSENNLHKFNILQYKNHFQTNHPKPSLWKFWKNNTGSKEINQYNIDWGFVKLWYWMREVERELKINNASISRCCLWKVKTAWWFIWKFNTLQSRY